VSEHGCFHDHGWNDRFVGEASVRFSQRASGTTLLVTAAGARVMAGQLVRRLSPRSRRVLQVSLSFALVIGIFVVVFRRIDVSAVWTQIEQMTWVELATITAIALWNLLTYWLLWVAVLPGLSLRRAMVVTASGTAVTNTVPGGSAVGVGLAYAMFDSWGFSRANSTIAVLVTGAWNTLIKFALPVLALALVALQGDATPQRVAAGLAGIGLLVVAVVLFALTLRSERVAFRIGELAAQIASRFRTLIRRPATYRWGQLFVDFRARSQHLLRDRWPAITIAALVSHLSLYLVLLVTLRHVGVSDAEVGWAQVLAVFAFARLVTAVRFTPGGAGVVEAVLIAGLVAAGGERARVAAAVLVFRFLTWLLPVPIGGLTYLGWRRQQGRRGAPQIAKTDLAVEHQSPTT
jgi:putative heme transporter